MYVNIRYCTLLVRGKKETAPGFSKWERGDVVLWTFGIRRQNSLCWSFAGLTFRLASLLPCDLMILALLSNAVQANTFTKAIGIELLGRFGFVNVASWALQQFVYKLFTIFSVRARGTKWDYCPRTPIVLTVSEHAARSLQSLAG